MSNLSNQVAKYFTYTITLPQSVVWEGKRAYQFMEQMLFAFQTLIFRIVATQERILWQIMDPVGYERSAVESAIRTSYPEAEIIVTPFGANELADGEFHRIIIKYQYKVPLFIAPVQYVTEITGSDPLATFTNAMTDLRAGEKIIYMVFVSGFAQYAYKEGQKLITRPVYNGSLLGLAFPLKIDRYTPELQRVLLGKLQQRLYETRVVIQIDSPDPSRLQSLIVVDNHIVGFDRANFNGLFWIADTPTNGMIKVTNSHEDYETSAIGLFAQFSDEERISKELQNLQDAMQLVLETRELATLWHLPHPGFTAPTIPWSHAQVRLPPRLVGQRTGVSLGVNVYAGRSEPVYIPDRSGHISLIGKAGVGKSTMLHHLIHQDIANNRGVAVLDPHGALVRDIVRWSIPAHRENDVVLLDVANEDFPPPMNLLAVPKHVERGNAAGQVMAVMGKIYDDFKEAPTVADALWTALVTLLYEDTPTIRDVSRLMSDAVYRARITAQVENAAAQEFWERFEMQKGQQEQLTRPILWRIRSFFGNTELYPILCHPDSLDFASLIKQNKIILVSLKADEARIPSREQQLLGVTLVSQLQLAVMNRPSGSVPYYLYIDEVQHFVTTTLETVFSEARKFGLSLTTANQYLKQLTGTVLDALIGNIGALAVFQCGHEDARVLAPYMSPGFDAESLINLNKFEAVVKMRFKEETLPAFSLRATEPLVNDQHLRQAIAREQHIRERSIMNYTPKSRVQVMDWLNTRYARSTLQQGQTNTAAIVDIDPTS